MNVQAVVGEVFRDYLHLFDLDGDTPLPGIIDSVFVKQLALDGAPNAQVVTVTEIGSTGVYMAEFTPNVPGRWMLRVEYDAPLNTQIFSVTVDAGGLGEAMMNAAYDDIAGVLYLEVWLERNGTLVPVPVSCNVDVYDRLGVLLFTLSSLVPKPDGRFALSQVTALAGDQPFNAVVTVTDSRGPVTTGQAFSSVV